MGRRARAAGRVSRQRLLTRSVSLGQLPHTTTIWCAAKPGKLPLDTNPKQSSPSCARTAGSPFPSTMPQFFSQRYITGPSSTRRAILPLCVSLAELQQRFFVRDEVVQIEEVRSMSVRIQSRSTFAAARRVHNQPSASPRSHRSKPMPRWRWARRATRLDALIAEIGKLTARRRGARAGQVRRYLSQLRDTSCTRCCSARPHRCDRRHRDAGTAHGVGARSSRRRRRRKSPSDARRLIGSRRAT